MSSPQGRKAKSESYAYSWFLPAPGSNGSLLTIQVPPRELEESGKPANSEFKAQEARTEQWRHSGKIAHPAPQSKLQGLDVAKLRVAGVAGWSALAGTGAVLLSTRGGAFPGFQLGVLGGVWIAVSAAVWFLPGILSTRITKKE